jgi:hypothetical protein
MNPVLFGHPGFFAFRQTSIQVPLASNVVNHSCDQPRLLFTTAFKPTWDGRGNCCLAKHGIYITCGNIYGIARLQAKADVDMGSNTYVIDFTVML